ncbi:MAG TPA: hypothetical protein VMT57_02810 [Candidatus Thermoplasmatota archaeon]|nr:hypothetical protein [Candidatus Thermoplasmatota archaeon]
MKKCLAVGIILLFIGVAVTPSINSNVVKTSDDSNLVEVTSQACGIQGFGNTTAKLTKQQYQNLEQYLVDFKTRLNQTWTREEAIPIFKDAVVELNKYGLLPQGISVETAQKLIIGGLYPTKILNLLKKILLFQNKKIDTPDDVLNLFCLVYTHAIHVYEINFITLIASAFGAMYDKYNLKVFYLLNELVFEYSQIKPLKFMNEIGSISPAYYYYTIGLKGVQNGSDAFFRAYGFSGIKIFLDYGTLEAVYFGYALEAKLVL